MKHHKGDSLVLNFHKHGWPAGLLFPFVGSTAAKIRMVTGDAASGSLTDYHLSSFTHSMTATRLRSKRLLERKRGCGTVEGGQEGCTGGATVGARDGARRFGFVTGAAVPCVHGTKVVKRPSRDGKRGDAG